MNAALMMIARPVVPAISARIVLMNWTRNKAAGNRSASAMRWPICLMRPDGRRMGAGPAAQACDQRPLQPRRPRVRRNPTGRASRSAAVPALAGRPPAVRPGHVGSVS